MEGKDRECREGADGAMTGVDDKVQCATEMDGTCMDEHREKPEQEGERDIAKTVVASAAARDLVTGGERVL